MIKKKKPGQIAYTAALAAGTAMLLTALAGYMILSVAPLWVRLLAFLGATLVIGVGVFTWDSWSRVVYSSRFKKGTASTLFTLAVVGILVLVNILGARYHWRWDMTRSGEFTLSAQTIDVLASLEHDVDITAFLTRDSIMREEVSALLREYEIKSPKVNVKFVDPERTPSVAQQYGITRSGVVVIETAGKRHDVTPLSLYLMGSTPGEIQFRGEQALTRGIMELTMQVGATIYFLTGHGGPTLLEDLKGVRSYLIGEGYQVKEINLAREGGLPEDADLVIIAGALRDLDARELQELESYLEKGKIMVMLGSSVRTSPQPNLKTLLNSVGIEVHDVLVVDPVRTYFMDPLSPIPRFNDHPTTRKLIENELFIVFPHARSLDMVAPGSSGLELRSIMTTSREAWGVKNWEQGIERSPEDLPGPLHLAVAVSRPLEDDSGETPGSPTDGTPPEPHERAVMLVLGNSYFMTDELLGFQGNLDIFMNSVEWLLGERALVSIRPKAPAGTQLFLTATDVRTIFYGTIIGLPLVVLFYGGFIWVRRRRM